jgi:hypothetical protein
MPRKSSSSSTIRSRSTTRRGKRTIRRRTTNSTTRGKRSSSVGEAPTAAAAAAAAVVAAQPYLQGQEKRLTHSRLTRRKYTVRLTKMLSNSMQTLQRDEEVRVRAKSRLLTGSRGLL